MQRSGVIGKDFKQTFKQPTFDDVAHHVPQTINEKGMTRFTPSDPDSLGVSGQIVVTLWFPILLSPGVRRLACGVNVSLFTRLKGSESAALLSCPGTVDPNSAPDSFI
jgi:hypothetical protein